MANSKFEYIRNFEHSSVLLPSTYIVVRIDGRGFHKLSSRYEFKKPNDRRALDLMNAAATAVLKELADIDCAYGVSDEFSFVLNRNTTLFDRRESKILTTVVSTFTSYYVHLWPEYFSEIPLTSPMPSFDGRVVLYPTFKHVRDYLSWRQVDCHINNLYNTAFWNLVLRGNMTATEAEEKLKGTVAAQKNEILFSHFQVNYNEELDLYKKGTMIYRQYGTLDHGLNAATIIPQPENAEISKTQKAKQRKERMKATIAVEHTDIIKDGFWESRPWLLSDIHPSAR